MSVIFNWVIFSTSVKVYKNIEAETIVALLIEILQDSKIGIMWKQEMSLCLSGNI